MRTRQKIILFAITPLFVAMCIIAFAVRYQAIALAAQQRVAVEQAYRASKEAELKHYVTLGIQAISYLYRSGANDQATQDKAKDILAHMDYGNDGYFFIYDFHGTNLMHPRLPNFVGNNFWDLRDAEGNATIQRLIERARAGGGYVRYSWQKPSLNKEAQKLGYVVALERWGWMVGSGIYLDDVDDALKKIDEQSSRNIRDTMVLLTAIAAIGVAAIAATGYLLNINESRAADAKLKMLAQRVVSTQEEERARLSRDLHDGISQELVFVKLQVESGIAALGAIDTSHTSKTSDMHDAPHDTHATQLLERAAAQLNHVLGEVRRISHDLRPALLDDLGLNAALAHLAQEFDADASIATQFSAEGSVDQLSPLAKTNLFRIAQEAITNIKRHAEATRVDMHLRDNGKTIELAIADNGCGFHAEEIDQHPKRGIGLRNMQERADTIGGRLDVITAPGAGTRIVVTLLKT
jgi:two-component system NarL family sensor kinase